jgi:uncharacterized protein YggU (UPF0235/DUF167 family)
MKARLTLRVRAGARRTEFAGPYADGSGKDIWKLHVAAPPVDGKANDAILRFLSKFAGVPSSAVKIVSGFTSATKIVELEGVDPASLRRAILESNGHTPNTGSAPPPKA